MAKEGLKMLGFFIDVPHFNNIGQHYGGTGALETRLIFHLPCNVKLCLSTHIHRSLGLFFFLLGQQAHMPFSWHQGTCRNGNGDTSSDTHHMFS